MGVKHSQPKSGKLKRLFQKLKKKKEKEIKKIDDIVCQFCNKRFESSNWLSFNIHSKECISAILGRKEKITPCVLCPPSYDSNLNELIFNNILEYEKNQPNNYVDKKIEDKIKELKDDLEQKKNLNKDELIVYLNRDTLLQDILKETKNVNLYLNWVINYRSEEGVDAGGLLRDFFSNIFQILEGEELKLFVQSESNDFSYILNPFLLQNEENLKYCRLIGLLLGKAILQNVTINICFNKLIYKMILCEKIELDDLMFIDSQLYHSLSNLKENLQIEGNENFDIKELGLDYSIELKDTKNHTHSLELIKNGRNITVENLDDFIKSRINFLIGLYEPFIKQIRDSFYEFIPVEKIKCLNSNELELLLNGRPFIDCDEWRSFTDYKPPYNANHDVIKWFWEVLGKLSQNELSNLLVFATGSSRVPLGGFKELESNNGKICRFLINHAPYVKNAKNYIKSHTCFNSIDLPCYENKEELEEAIRFVSKNQIWDFGME